MENLIKLPEFNVGKITSWEESLGISDKRTNFLKSSILFEIITNDIIRNEFFDKESEVPEDLKLVTTPLSKAFERAETLKEQIFCLLIFDKGYNSLQNMLQKERESDFEGREEIELEFEKALRDSLGQDIQAYSLTSIKNYIRTINFNFDKFIELVIKEKDYDSKGNKIVANNFTEELTEEKINEIKNNLDESFKEILKKYSKKGKDSGEGRE